MKNLKVLIGWLSRILISVLLVGCSQFQYQPAAGIGGWVTAGLVAIEAKPAPKSKACSNMTKIKQEVCQKQVDDLLQSVNNAKNRYQPIDQDNWVHSEFQ